jgi:hypothetical protein
MTHYNPSKKPSDSLVTPSVTRASAWWYYEALMALGKCQPKQPDLWIAAPDLPTVLGHPFYQKLNPLLGEADFDRSVEDLCRPYYTDGVGRPGIPPGVYVRMLFIGYFEGLDSQRGIAGRCADSRARRRAREFRRCAPPRASGASPGSI